MPGKSHKKGKRKSRQRFQARIVRQPAVIQTGESVARPASVTTLTQPKPAIVRYPYIASELRAISILAALMLAIIAVLALVL